jgi:triacylglycerol lipase
MLARQMRRAQLVELVLYGALAAWMHARGWSAPAALLLVPAMALGSRFVVVCTMHLLAWIHRSPRADSERIAIPTGLLMLLREYGAFVAMSLLYTPWEALFVRPDPAVDTKGELPVVLVHGFFVNRGCWRPLVRRQDEEGVAPVFAPDCRSHMATIECFEEDLHAAIERISGRGARRVAIVAHSMGGLAARLYLARRGAGRVAKLITIGSPHHGTRLAPWGMGPNARQMEPGSRFLMELEAREGDQPKPPTLSIYSPHDDMVMPQDSSRLAWARNVPLAGHGHLSLFGAPEVAHLVIEELRRRG